MNTATPVNLSDLNTPPEKFSLLVLALIVMFPGMILFIFAFPLLYIFMPVVALYFLFFRQTRIHAVFVIAAYATLFIPNVFTGQLIDWSEKIVPKIIGSTGLFLLQYIPSSFPDLPLILLFFWSLVLVPIAVMEAFYWLIHYKQKVLTAVFAVVLLTGSVFMLQFGEQTIASYNAVKELKGQSMPVEELYATCGKPLYLEYDRGPVHLMPHWIYTNGSKVISMTIDANGIASIYENEYIFFD